MYRFDCIYVFIAIIGSLPLLMDYRYEDLLQFYMQTSDQKGYFPSCFMAK